MFYVDFSPPESAATILKVLVPGLEVETMTYERIGRRNVRRLEAAGSPIVRRDGRGKLVRLVAGDEVWLDSQALGEAMGSFYALYREPGRHVLGLLERGVQG